MVEVTKGWFYSEGQQGWGGEQAHSGVMEEEGAHSKGTGMSLTLKGKRSRRKWSLELRKERLNRRRKEGWRRWRWGLQGWGGRSDRARREAERGW